MNEVVIPAEDHESGVKEAHVVREWRTEQLRRLGVPSVLADSFADEVDWHALSALIKRGCPLVLALQIVR